MDKMVVFKVSNTSFAIDHALVKKTYSKQELFGEHAEQTAKLKMKLDGQDIPLYDLPAIFGESTAEHKTTRGDAILIKDDKGHMVLLTDQIEGIFETESYRAEDLSPVFGNRSCSYFPGVFTKGDVPVLMLNPSALRADADTKPTGEIYESF